MPRFGFVAAIVVGVTGTADAQQLQVSPIPKSIHSYPAARTIVDTDGKAAAVVQEILSHFGIGAIQWKVTVTDDNADTAFAIARFHPTTKQREIIFNKEFMGKISDSGAGRWPAYCVAAHEAAHHLRFHLEVATAPINIKRFELEADYYCGFLLGKLGANYENSVAAIRWYTDFPSYPTREERLAQIGVGWRDATGRGVPVNEARFSPKAIPQPKQVEPPSTSILQKFGLRKNRDIYGYDITFTDGRAGIPGVTVEECAQRCDANSSCRAFSFDKWAGRCFLKRAIATSLLDPPSILGVKRPAELPQVSQDQASMIVIRRKRFRDKPIITKRVDGFDACWSACGSELRCIAFTYLKTKSRGENCEMFNEFDRLFFGSNC